MWEVSESGNDSIFATHQRTQSRKCQYRTDSICGRVIPLCQPGIEYSIVPLGNWTQKHCKGRECHDMS